MLKKRAVVYARFSSQNQRETSIEQQIDACKEYTQLHGYSIIHTYADRALTGRSDDRPEFQKMMQDAELELFQYIIVYKSDRFARNRYDSAIHKKKLKDYNIKILYAAEPVPDSACGVIIETMLEGMAEYYSVNLSENVKRGQQYNATRGIPNNKLPFGYEKNDDNKIVPNPMEAIVVKNLFEFVSNGGKVSEFHRHLQLNNIYRKDGTEIGKSTLYHMLKNERYVGTYIFGDIRLENCFEPIVDIKVFNAVKKRCMSRSHSTIRENYLLRGHIKCEHCGRLLITQSGTSKTKNVHYYYRCSNSKCQMEKYIPKEDLERSVKYHITTTLKDTYAVNNLIQGYLNQFDISSKTNLYQEQLKDIQNKLKNIVSAIEVGEYSSTLITHLKELETHEKYLEQQLYFLKTEPCIYTKGDLEEILGKISLNLSYIDFKLLLRFITKSITVSKMGVISVEYMIHNINIM